MKRRLSRTKLAKICAAYDSGALSPTAPGAMPRPFDAVYVYASEPLTAGEPLTVAGFKNASTYETVRRLLRAGRLVLSAEIADAPGAAHALALQNVPEGKVGVARLTAGFFQDILCADGTVPTTVPGFKVAAASALNASTRHAVVFLTPTSLSTATTTRSSAVTSISGSVESGVLRIDVTTSNQFITGITLS